MMASIRKTSATDDNSDVASCLICYDELPSCTMVVMSDHSNDIEEGEGCHDVTALGLDHDQAEESTINSKNTNTSTTNVLRLIQLKKCSHTFCTDCLESHCEHTIIRTKQVPIPCPCHGENPPCPSSLSPAAVRLALLGTRSVLPATATATKRSASAITSTTIITTPQDVEQGHSLEVTTTTTTTATTFTTSNSTQDDDNKNNNSKNKSSDDNWWLWKRYEKLLCLAQDPTLISCPKCDNLIAPSTLSPPSTMEHNNDPSTRPTVLSSSSTTTTSSATTSPTTTPTIEEEEEEEDPESPAVADAGSFHDDTRTAPPAGAVVCPTCWHIFCRIHGDLHNPLELSCHDYAQTKQAKQIHQSEQVLNEYTKPCSHCGCRIFKESGCDHVVCLYCGNDMCFKCGSHLFLTGKEIRQCANCRQSYLDHRYDHIHRRRSLCCLPLLLPLYIIYTTVMTVVALASFCFCCCCGCTAYLDTDPPSRQTPWRAMQVGFYIVVMPFLFILYEFGCETEFVVHAMTPPGDRTQQQQLPGGGGIKEIPTMISLDDDDDFAMSSGGGKERQQPQSFVGDSNTIEKDNNRRKLIEEALSSL